PCSSAYTRNFEPDPHRAGRRTWSRRGERTMGEAKRRASAGYARRHRGGNDYSTGDWALNIPELRRRPELVRKFIEVFGRIRKAERDQIWGRGCASLQSRRERRGQ